MERIALRVLLVDDDPDDYALVLALLRGARRYRVALDWIAVFDDALAAMAREAHDVYLVDDRLGARDGLDLLRAAQARGCTTPTIILTGQDDAEADDQAMGAGAADYLVKRQIDTPALERAICHARGRTRALVALQRSDERFRALFKAGPLPTYAWQRRGDDWTLVDYNDAAVAITEGAVAGLLGQSARALYGGRPQVLEDLARCARDGAPLHRQMSWRFSSTGREAFLAITFVPVPPDLVVVQTEDVTARLRAEEALRTSEERFRAITEQATDLISVVAADGTIRYASPSHARLLGHAPEGMTDRQMLRQVHPDDAPALRATFEALCRDAVPRMVRFRLRHADGSWRTMEATAVNRLDDPAVQGIIATTRDVTERKRAEEQVRFQATLLGAVGQAVIATALDGTITYWNAAAATLYGWSAEEALGRKAADLIPTESSGAQAAEIMAQLRKGQPWSGEFPVRRRDGSTFPVLVTDTPIRDEQGRLVGLVGVSLDLTERKRLEDALRHQALYDALTDLPNRALLHDRLQQALFAARRDGTPLALLLLDLDRFKEINDTFGHPAGDRLLQEVATRFRGALRASDTIARLGGDEFAVLLPATDDGGARQVARHLHAALQAPFPADGQPLQVGASIGIALCPGHGTDPTTLLRRADVAMYTAKRTGSGAALYDAGHDQHSPQRLALLADLRQAIARAELALHYQPKVQLSTGRVPEVEALVRWAHPRHGPVAPADFIPLAEQHGLIAPLTLCVLEEALRQCHCWQQEGLGLGVAVNLSMWNLHDPDLPDLVGRHLQLYGMPAGRLRLELTESTLMAETARTLDVLARLRALGVRLSVDDFGTGYSSLAYLKRLPVDELKIDRSFVRHMAQEEADAAIVRATIDLGRSLGLQVVAEGVENQESWDLLAQWGCDLAQGYYLSRPLPATDLARWLAARFREAGRLSA